MNRKKIRGAGTLALVLIWGVLTLFCWFGTRQEVSLSERRPLNQFPEVTGSSVLSGKFMENFEKATLDQFPLRDRFRSLKSMVHAYVLRQKDNNGLYLADGYLAKLEYPLNESSVSYALRRFNWVYDTYLRESGASPYLAVVPDKGYYLAEDHGYPAMDYAAMFAAFQEGMPWAETVDLSGTLEVSDYYHTDTHWRQEALVPVAQLLCDAMEIGAFSEDEVTFTPVAQPFYGVYSGQAALPVKPDTLYLTGNDLLSDCVTCVGELDNSGQGIFRELYSGVYDMDKLEGDDLYEVYLSGSQSLLRIENPHGEVGRTLVVFRDSFGSSLVPLLMKGYSSVTVVDIRYVRPDLLNRFEIPWDGDVLFLYSTLVLNNSSTLQ